MENIFAFQAIQKLVPNADCIIGETYESINWAHESRGKPTEAEFDEALASIKAEYDAQAYARTRQTEYPPLAEQLDLLWHAIDTGTLDNRDHRNKFYSKLKQVKENNPKG